MFQEALSCLFMDSQSVLPQTVTKSALFCGQKTHNLLQISNISRDWPNLGCVNYLGVLRSPFLSLCLVSLFSSVKV